MSYLINNELTWIAVPRCASMSIEDALLNSNLQLTPHSYVLNNNEHIHISLSSLNKEFGYKETVCINRDWFDKWYSSLSHIFRSIKVYSNYTPIKEWEDVDNDLIYDIFTDELINKIYNIDNDCYYSFVKEKYYKKHKLPSSTVSIILSKKFWCNNQKCTYEYDISEINKFAELIENKFGEKITIRKLNDNPEVKSKIIIDDKLKSWVWDKFEKPFIKTKKLI